MSTTSSLEKCNACHGFRLPSLDMEVLRGTQRPPRSRFTFTTAELEMNDFSLDNADGDASMSPKMAPSSPALRAKMVKTDDTKIFLTLQDVEQIKSIKEGLEELSATLHYTLANDDVPQSTLNKTFCGIAVVILLIAVCVFFYGQIADLENELNEAKMLLKYLNKTCGGLQNGRSSWFWWR